jgi:hypothetical protein
MIDRAVTDLRDLRATDQTVRKRIELGKVSKYNPNSGVGCVRSSATGHFTGCGYLLVPNGATCKVGDMVNAVVGTAPHEDNNHWSPCKVVLINGFVNHG